MEPVSCGEPRRPARHCGRRGAERRQHPLHRAGAAGRTGLSLQAVRSRRPAASRLRRPWQEVGQRTEALGAQSGGGGGGRHGTAAYRRQAGQGAGTAAPLRRDLPAGRHRGGNGGDRRSLSRSDGQAGALPRGIRADGGFARRDGGVVVRGAGLRALLAVQAESARRRAHPLHGSPRRADRAPQPGNLRRALGRRAEGCGGGRRADRDPLRRPRPFQGRQRYASATMSATRSCAWPRSV